MTFGKRRDDEFPRTRRLTVVGDAFDIRQTHEFRRETRAEQASHAHRLKVIRHARRAIDDADFLRAAIARELRRIVNYVTDLRETGGRNGPRQQPAGGWLGG